MPRPKGSGDAAVVAPAASGYPVPFYTALPLPLWPRKCDAAPFHLEYTPTASARTPEVYPAMLLHDVARSEPASASVQSQ